MSTMLFYWGREQQNWYDQSLIVEMNTWCNGCLQMIMHSYHKKSYSVKAVTLLGTVTVINTVLDINVDIFRVVRKFYL